MKRALIALVALLGCGNGEPASLPTDTDAPVEVLVTGSLPTGTLRKLDEITLQGGDSGFVYGIQTIVVENDTIFILDSFDRYVKVYDSIGWLVNRFGGKGKGPGELVDPMGMVVDGERIMIIDPGRGRMIAMFHRSGAFDKLLHIRTPRTPRAFARVDDRLAVMNPVFDTAQEGLRTTRILDATGEIVANGCTLPPVYAASNAMEGFLSRSQFGELVARDHDLYCYYSASSLVQQIDADGRTVRRIVIEPDFYKPPVDEAGRGTGPMFDREWARKFLISWTPLISFHPLPDGFLATFGVPRGDVMRMVAVACRAPTHDCFVVDLPGGIVHVARWDAVWVKERVGGDDPMRLGVYAVSPP